MNNSNPMHICKNCGVELDAEMQNCPLCNEVKQANDNEPLPLPDPQQPFFNYNKRRSPKQKKFTWELISIILLSGIATTLAIDLIMHGSITWSEYPVAISLTIFSYISLLTFWKQKILIQMAGSFILSSSFILIIDALTNTMNWSLDLGIPILVAANIATAAMVIAIRISKYKGINLIAYSFFAATLMCLFIDGISSFYQLKTIQLHWSLIVSGSTIPVVFVLLFVHFRLKKGRNLKKTFHI